MLLVRLNVFVAKFCGKKFVVNPPIFKVAPFETENVPPAIVVPLLAENVERSSVPAVTNILPSDEVVELKAGRLPAKVFVKAPLIFRVE